MLLKKKHKKRVTQVNRDKSPPSVWGDILYLVSKLLMVGFVLATLYFFVFGLLRYNDDGMKPALKDGDLLVYSYKGKERVARVIATEGSTIDINENGLIINGSPQQEQDIYKETLLYKEGATFPMKVPAGQLFVLGDNRTTAVDSRAFGTIPIQDTQGKVVTVIRRRGF